MPGSGTLLLVGRENETRCMRVLKQISFIELSRYCRCKIGTAPLIVSTWVESNLMSECCVVAGIRFGRHPYGSNNKARKS